MVRSSHPCKECCFKDFIKSHTCAVKEGETPDFLSLHSVWVCEECTQIPPLSCQSAKQGVFVDSHTLGGIFAHAITDPTASWNQTFWRVSGRPNQAPMLFSGGCLNCWSYLAGNTVFWVSLLIFVWETITVRVDERAYFCSLNDSKWTLKIVRIQLGIFFVFFHQLSSLGWQILTTLITRNLDESLEIMYNRAKGRRAEHC